MKTALTLFVLSLFVVSALPAVLATDAGVGIPVGITTEQFAPLVWMCDSRVVLDDATEPWRTSPDGTPLVERLYNYAFEGEQVQWIVLVMDKNGIQKVADVYATIGTTQGEGNDIEANCVRNPIAPGLPGAADIAALFPGQPLVAGPVGADNPLLPNLPQSCNARILEERLVDYNDDLMGFYTCTFTVETSDSMYGEHWVTIEAVDLDGLMGTMDENEYWFFNPIVALSVDGDLIFENVRPGVSAYSDTLLVGNDADAGSGVMLDMFITGTDFYDSSSSGAACPNTNQLQLYGPGPDGAFDAPAVVGPFGDFDDDTGFFYFATNGAYSTLGDDEINPGFGGGIPTDIVERACDAEGYCNIEYGIGFNNPSPFYDNTEILQDGGPVVAGVGYRANTLTPGAEMALTFRLNLPEPCNGDFDTGQLFFWGEAI